VKKINPKRLLKLSEIATKSGSKVTSGAARKIFHRHFYTVLTLSFALVTPERKVKKGYVLCI
jgi:hypothetical protein